MREKAQSILKALGLLVSNRITHAKIRCSMLGIDHPEIKELDINPLVVHEQGQGATVADVRIILSKPAVI